MKSGRISPCGITPISYNSMDDINFDRIPYHQLFKFEISR